MPSAEAPLDSSGDTRLLLTGLFFYVFAPDILDFRGENKREDFLPEKRDDRFLDQVKDLNMGITSYYSGCLVLDVVFFLLCFYFQEGGNFPEKIEKA